MFPLQIVWHLLTFFMIREESWCYLFYADLAMSLFQKSYAPCVPNYTVNFKVREHEEAKSMDTYIWILVSGVPGPFFFFLISLDLFAVFCFIFPSKTNIITGIYFIRLFWGFHAWHIVNTQQIPLLSFWLLMFSRPWNALHSTGQSQWLTNTSWLSDKCCGTNHFSHDCYGVLFKDKNGTPILMINSFFCFHVELCKSSLHISPFRQKWSGSNLI